jgi:hypothetical protein
VTTGALLPRSNRYLWQVICHKEKPSTTYPFMIQPVNQAGFNSKALKYSLCYNVCMYIISEICLFA